MPTIARIGIWRALAIGGASVLVLSGDLAHLRATVPDRELRLRHRTQPGHAAGGPDHGTRCAARSGSNRAHARLRGPGERANAQLKTWRVLDKLRCCPHRAGQLAKAIHVLQDYEITAG